MATVKIREYNDQARTRSGLPTFLPTGPLVTDELGKPIKVVTTAAATPVDSPRLEAQTHLVCIEASANVRYAIWPYVARYALDYDPIKRYETGAYVRFDDGDGVALWKSNQLVSSGQTPLTAAAKWDRFVCTADHPLAPATTPVIEHVWAGCQIAFLEE